MKLLTLTSIVLISIGAQAQAFYKTYKTNDFQTMLKSGVVYIDGGTEEDSTFIAAFEKYWDSCPFKVVDPEEGDKITTNDFVFVPGEETLIAEASQLQGEGINKYLTIGYLMNNGFGLEPESEAGIKLIVAFMNSCIQQIDDKEISGRSGQVNDRLEKIYLKESAYDSGKTLLVVGDNKNSIKIESLTKLGMKCKEVTEKEFNEIDEEDYKDYYILYVDSRDFFTFSIFDLEDMKLVLTHRDSSTAIRSVKESIIKKWIS